MNISDYKMNDPADISLTQSTLCWEKTNNNNNAVVYIFKIKFIMHCHSGLKNWNEYCKLFKNVLLLVNCIFQFFQKKLCDSECLMGLVVSKILIILCYKLLVCH